MNYNGFIRSEYILSCKMSHTPHFLRKALVTDCFRFVCFCDILIILTFGFSYDKIY